ncbi:response regulator receiver domain-containing protein [Spirosoma oryzae]|uniref:Response regulator receiver domain-containing protein n=1 Tax=Spirosoma oryzae TaxID=1469603 RepID=A0A2T0RXJ6_9BACT|nr:response regulator [Spirosoma oryzae]PRY25870.1 response regulator receiver domain-containing protein [Spirosoma oryzae]
MVDSTNVDPFDQMPIIHIENDIDYHYLVEKALRLASIRNPVRFFTNGQQALAYLQTTNEVPLVILCDIIMPGMDGFELRDRIDADPVLRLKAIPFVYFSTWSTKELVEKAYQGTIQGYHLKGERFADLQAELLLIVAYWKRCLHLRSFQ